MGLCKLPEYNVWSGMIKRCTYKGDPSYACYGAKGVTVCDRWRNSFECFLYDMGRRPDGCCIDRIDPRGSYVPENVRWVSRHVSLRNRRSNLDEVACRAALKARAVELSEKMPPLGASECVMREWACKRLQGVQEPITTTAAALALGIPGGVFWARKMPSQSWGNRDGRWDYAYSLQDVITMCVGAIASFERRGRKREKAGE